MKKWTLTRYLSFRFLIKTVGSVIMSIEKPEVISPMSAFKR